MISIAELLSVCITQHQYCMVLAWLSIRLAYHLHSLVCLYLRSLVVKTGSDRGTQVNPQYALSATGCSRNHSGSQSQMFSLHHCQVGNAGHGGRNLVCLGTGKPGSAPPRVGPQGQAGRHVDHWVSADPTGAPAILQVDSCPQAILKFRPPNSLD